MSSELPEYYRYRKDNGGHSFLQPFKYLHNERQFAVADALIAVTEFDPYSYYPSNHGLEFDGISVDEMTKEPLNIPSMGATVGTPKLHEWTKNNVEEARSDSLEVMRTVFIEWPSIPTRNAT
jgi:hypothetical protein